MQYCATFVDPEQFKVGKVVHMVALFLHHLLGALLRRLAIFIEENCFVEVQQFSNLTFTKMGGDVTQNDDFQKWRTALQGLQKCFKRN